MVPNISKPLGHQRQKCDDVGVYSRSPLLTDLICIQLKGRVLQHFKKNLFEGSEPVQVWLMFCPGPK